MVKKDLPSIIWNKRAAINLQKAYKYIKEDSPANAQKVRNAIIKMVDGLSSNPEKYPLDKFKMNNPGNYRAFEKYSYRIAYKYTTKEIRVLRFRHTKQEPRKY